MLTKPILCEGGQLTINAGAQGGSVAVAVLDDDGMQHEDMRMIDCAVLDTDSWIEVPEQMRRQADTIWFRSFLEFDAAEILRRTRQPTLILHGAADSHVLPHHAQRLAELARSRRGNGSVELVILEGLAHTLAKGGGPGSAGRQQSLQHPQVVAPALLTPLTSWLRKAP